MAKKGKECIDQQGSNSEIYGKMQAVFVEMDETPDVSATTIKINMILPKYLLQRGAHKNVM